MVRSQCALDDLPAKAVAVNATNQRAAQKNPDGSWSVPGIMGSWPTADLMDANPGPWVVGYTGPTRPTYPEKGALTHG